MKKFEINQSGFTLVELMIILAIFGILAGITVSSYSELLPQIRLYNAAQTIVSDIKSAKIRAIATRKEYKINFDVANDSYYFEEGNKANSSTSWPGTVNEVIRSFNDSSNLYYYKGIDIDSVNQNPIFNPNGLSSMNSTTTIKIQNDNGAKKRITINITGGIKLYNGWE